MYLTLSSSTITLLLAILLIGCSGKDYLDHAEKLNITRGVEIDHTFRSIHELFPVQEPKESVDNEDLVAQPEFHRMITFGSTDEVIVGVIGALAVDENSRVFLADRDQTTIHVFESDGGYLTSLGRHGEGPGEFVAVSMHTDMKIYSNYLYVTDLTDMKFYFPHRIHVFSLEDLSFSRTIDLLAKNREEIDELNGYYSKRIYPRDDSTFLVSYHRSPNEYQDEESTIYYFIQDSNGMILSGPVLKQKDLTHLVYEVRNAPIPYLAVSPFPFFGKSLLAVSSDGHLYVANHTEEFKIDIYDANGKHIRTIQHPLNNKPLSRNVLINRYERLGENVSVNMIREAENLPEIWPALNDMLIDDENRLWVSTIVEDFEIYEWWVLESSGEVITRFEWPRDEPIEVVRNGFIYTRETDEETGLQQVVRYRIEMEAS